MRHDSMFASSRACSDRNAMMAACRLGAVQVALVEDDDPDGIDGVQHLSTWRIPSRDSRSTSSASTAFSLTTALMPAPARGA